MLNTIPESQALAGTDSRNIEVDWEIIEMLVEQLDTLSVAQFQPPFYFSHHTLHTDELGLLLCICESLVIDEAVIFGKQFVPLFLQFRVLSSLQFGFQFCSQIGWVQD